MGTNVSLTPSLEHFAQSCVESGRYNNVSEVVRSLEAATAEAVRDGFRTDQDVEASVMAVIAEARERGG